MSDLYKLDVVFRKMLRMIVGPPSFVEWNAPWHEILHHWNGKAVALAQQHGLNPWSEQSLKHHWKFAMHVANLPSNRWVKRVLLFGIRLAHEHGGTQGTIGQANSWHTRDFINWGNGLAFRRIRHCGCS